MAYEFPFDVPEDLSALSRDELNALSVLVDEHARTLVADESASLEAIDATHALRASVAEAKTRFSTADTRRAELAAGLEEDQEEASDPAVVPDPAVDPTGDTPDEGDDGDGNEAESGEPVGVTASAGKPRVKQVAGKAPVASSGAPAHSNPAYASMIVAADVPDFSTGQKLTSFSDAGRAIEARMASYSLPGASRRGGKRLPEGAQDAMVAGGAFQMGAQVARHGAVRLNRLFPDELRISSGDNAYEKVLAAADERRLPGGSLVESAKLAVQQGRSLTAAAGWCAPSETIYSLCELESMDGLLDLPEVQANRGGFSLPEDGGPNFAVLWNGIGAAGDTHLTEYEVENDTAKVCFSIPCPNFVDVRLGVDYVCLTGGLLQRRGYPEVIDRFSRGSVIALAHKINRGVIADIVTAAGAATVIAADAGGDDAPASILSGIELAIIDMKYRNRMPFAATVEVVLPMWVLHPIRAAMARRGGIGRLDVTDAEIMGWFADRHAAPRFVYDWQDALSGLGTGPGGAVALAVLPATVNALVYPAGTFTKAVADVVSLDTVYDAASLATNEYTAVFAEDGWAVLQTCPDVRQYTLQADPSGDLAP